MKIQIYRSMAICQHEQTMYHCPTSKRLRLYQHWYIVVFLLFIEMSWHYLAAQELADLNGQELSPLVNTSTSQRHEEDCYCLNGSVCDRRTRFCPDGCQDGWARTSESGPCDKITPQSQQLNSSSPAGHSEHKITQFKDIVTSRDNHQGYDMDISFLRQSQYALQLQPYNICMSIDSNQFINTWTVDLPTWYMVRGLFLLVEGLSELYENQLTLILTSTFSSPREEITCKGTPSAFCSLMFNSTHFAKSLRIETKKYQAACPPHTITTLILLGLPVCPYFHWGFKCQRRCYCTCEDVSCHPLTGVCNAQDFSCQSGFYGEMCDRKCAPNCDISPLIKGCHRITGLCKACALVKSESCTPESIGLSPGDTINKLKCQTDKGNFSGMKWLMSGNVNSSFPRPHSTTTRSPPMASGNEMLSDKGMILVIVVGSIIMVVVLVLCIWVGFELFKKREWRKERDSYLVNRWKDRLSMKTLNGFDMEFQEMEYNKRSTQSLPTDSEIQKTNN